MHCDDSHCLLPSSFRGIKTGKQGRKYTNSIQFATSKCSSKYFCGSLFQAAGGHRLYICAGLCTTPSSYALLLSNKASRLCFFLPFVSAALAWRWAWDMTHSQFYGLCFCSFCFRFPVRARTTWERLAQKPLLTPSKGIKCTMWTSSGQRRSYFCPADLLWVCGWASIMQWRAAQSSSSCSGHYQKTPHGALQQLLEAAAQLWKQDEDATLHLTSLASNDRRCHVLGTNSSYNLTLCSCMVHFWMSMYVESSCCIGSWTQMENGQDI